VDADGGPPRPSSGSGASDVLVNNAAGNFVVKGEDLRPTAGAP
jgi:hypothetical protein